MLEGLKVGVREVPALVECLQSSAMNTDIGSRSRHIQGLGLRVKCLGFRVKGLGFRV